MDAATAPDLSQGVFETLLVVDREPVELEAHLTRLGASLAELFGAAAPPGLGDAVRRRAADFELGRLRIDVAPGLSGTRATIAAEAVDAADFFPGGERGAALRTAIHPGGLGAHKWADRRPLTGAAEGTVRLLLDRDGEVLEASRANVFAVFGAELATPRADGRILPGIARAGALAAARETGIESVERRLRRDELLAADEVFLTGSVRGVEPACSLDGVPLAPRGPLSRQIGEGLRRRWLGVSLAAAAPAPAAAPPPGPPAR
jgi:para-aminobenzoate synthetase/4-amino-4-deoxychorismate lyase